MRAWCGRVLTLPQSLTAFRTPLSGPARFSRVPPTCRAGARRPEAGVRMRVNRVRIIENR